MLINNDEYFCTVESIKEDIRRAHYKAVVAVNKELIMLYHRIGTVINTHKTWGNKFIDNLAYDIRVSFPGVKGFSIRNLKYMSKFASLFEEDSIVQQVVAQIPWGHIIVLIDRLKDKRSLEWYIGKSAENGWSRSVLVHQLDNNLYERQVLAEKVSNYECRLSEEQRELALKEMKDPYIFDFISFRSDIAEKEVENALVTNITKLLLELGNGFSFMGHQYHLNVGGEDFYLDLLFYNINLKSYFVIELKNDDFKPEYAGKLNFYLSAVDELLKKPDDNPSIGLLLCKGKNKLIAEYSLRDMTKPMGVSEYKLTGLLPEEFKNKLPSIEDFERRI